MMLTEAELRKMLTDLESETVERTRAFDKADKMGQAISAFANDLGEHKKPGYLLLGVENDGRISGKRIDDEQLTSLGGLKMEGTLLPPPAMAMDTFHFPEGDVVVIEVFPSAYPPIRYRGQVWVRVGARKALASEEDLHILAERRQAAGVRFEECPCPAARLDDMELDLFRNIYLPRAIKAEVIDDDERPIKEQMAALRFYDRKTDSPTNLGLLLFGKHPEMYIPSAYLQYVKFDSKDNGGTILAEHAYKGPLIQTIAELDAFVKVGISSPRPVKISALQEKTVCDYPDWSMRELLLNAVIHRDYQIGNAPIKFYEYSNRIELSNPGGLYGQANPENFPYVNDYRNPLLAEAMKIMGYVNKYNRGIAKIKKEMESNGNPPPVFDVNKITEFRVTLRPSVGDISGEINGEINGEIKAPNGDAGEIRGEIKAKTGEVCKINGEINAKSGEIKIYDAIAENPGIKREKLLLITGIPLRTIDRIVKRLIEIKKIEYRGSKRTGGWFVRT